MGNLESWECDECGMQDNGENIFRCMTCSGDFCEEHILRCMVCTGDFCEECKEEHAIDHFEHG